MAELDLSLAARADLVDIRIYSLEQFGPEVADRYYRGFKEAFSLLVERPLAGQAMPEFGKHIRCLTHRKHRILYVVKGQVVLVVRVLHHAIDAKRALGGKT